MMHRSRVVNGIRVLYDDACVNRETPMQSEDAPWVEKAKRLVRTEMVRQGATYEDLANRLAAIGVTDNPPNLRNKVSRGTFTAAFLLQCMEALGTRILRFDP